MRFQEYLNEVKSVIKKPKVTQLTVQQSQLHQKKAELHAVQSTLSRQQAQAKVLKLGHKHGAKKVSTKTKLGHKGGPKAFKQTKSTGGGEGLLSKEFGSRIRDIAIEGENMSRLQAFLEGLVSYKGTQDDRSQ